MCITWFLRHFRDKNCLPWMGDPVRACRNVLKLLHWLSGLGLIVIGHGGAFSSAGWIARRT
jgi:hypothetical protein